jgi:hypothetical protein
MGWQHGDHRLICLVFDPNDDARTGTLRNSHK